MNKSHFVEQSGCLHWILPIRASESWARWEWALLSHAMAKNGDTQPRCRIVPHIICSTTYHIILWYRLHIFASWLPGSVKSHERVQCAGSLPEIRRTDWHVRQKLFRSDKIYWNINVWLLWCTHLQLEKLMLTRKISWRLEQLSCVNCMMACNEMTIII